MGKIKSRNRRASVASGASMAFNSIWSLYAATTTAGQLPSDAERLRKMMADPPFELPYILAAISLALLLWSFWPSKGTDDVNDNDNDDKGGSGGNTTRGEGSHIFSGNFENSPVTVNPPNASGGLQINDCIMEHNGVCLVMDEGTNVDINRTTLRHNQAGIIVIGRGSGADGNAAKQDDKHRSKYVGGFSFSKGDDNEG